MTARVRALLLAIVLLGFALRLYALDGQSLWYDEGVTAMVAQRDLVELTRWTANDIQPPLYYYVVAGWGRLAGWSEWALRFPSAWFGTAAIPLLAVLAFRLSRLRSAALIAALLAAFHPLLVYYAQEARMYTLLVLLGILAAYLLVRVAEPQRRSLRLWVGYVAAATAAIYTHYFAIFLLVGLGCAWLLDASRVARTRHAGSREPAPMWQAAEPGRRDGTWWLPLVVANAAVAVLYLPWLANLVTRLRVDRSYWTGTLKLHEALLDVALRFTSGETMGERTALWLLLLYGLITAAAAVGLWRSWPQTRRTVIYALFWLCVPVVAVLVLAFNVPKFNPRYVMLAAPSLLLIWAVGLAALGWQYASTLRNGVAAPPRKAIAALGVLLLLLGGAWSNYNWFFNHAFDKDHWRQVAAFLRDRLAEDEVIVLVSGHAWPVWEYYAADLPVVRLPQLEILDVDAVLDFATTGPPLIAAFDEAIGKRGAWLVNWQEEVVDPNDVTPVQLELGGREKGQNATFNGLTVRRWGGIRPARLVTAPPIDHPLDIAFGDQVILRGYKVLNNGDLLLFWQQGAAAGVDGGAGTVPDLHMALATSTVDGAPLAQPPDRRLAGYTYPSFRWGPDEVVLGHVPARDWLGENPQNGAVQFRLRVYDARDPHAAALVTPGGEADLLVAPVEVVID
jgi:4-amino-4-deoxy-L-arabinose transferase-like glycosyltransferase